MITFTPSPFNCVSVFLSQSFWMIAIKYGMEQQVTGSAVVIKYYFYYRYPE